MFPQTSPAHSPTVGENNGECAHQLLRAHGIQIVSESLFGEGLRQIIFDVARGDVWARQIKPTEMGESNIKETA
jgi:chemotaxis protein CheD